VLAVERLARQASALLMIASSHAHDGCHSGSQAARSEGGYFRPLALPFRFDAADNPASAAFMSAFKR
jgi:hypothetical protein